MNLCAVDTDQLNTNLYQLSRAIKSKLTFNKSLIFPEDFISVLSEIDISNEEAVKEVAKQKYVATVFNKQVSTLDNDLVREINNLGAGNKNLTYVNLPNVTYLVNNAFSNCQKLSNINLPKVATLGASAVFINCKALTSLYLPSLQSREEDGWGQLCANDSSLTKVYFPIYTGYIGEVDFQNCTALDTLILGGNIVCNLVNTNAFNNTPIKNKKGYIYVPKNLLIDYQNATNWSTYTSQIRAIEDYPSILEGWN